MVPLEEADGGVCLECLGIQMKLEGATLYQLCEVPKEILTHQGLFCKTQEKAEVMCCSLQGLGQGKDQKKQAAVQRLNGPWLPRSQRHEQVARRTQVSWLLSLVWQQCDLYWYGTPCFHLIL